MHALQELFARARRAILKNPDKYAFRNIQVAVLLRRARQRRSLDVTASMARHTL